MNRFLSVMRVSLCVSAIFLTTTVLAQQPGLVHSEFLFDPAPHPQCHASTIVETKSGLVAAWFGGTKEGNPDVGIWLSRYKGGKWTPPVEVANGSETEEPRVNCLNPVLFQPPGGPLLLFYKTGKWWAYVKRSTDDGATWSKPERLYNGFFGPVKNKPVMLDDGSILSPTSTEFTTPEGRAWQVHFERSIDGGESWQRIGPVNEGLKIHAIQPSILFHPNHQLQALGRTQEGRLYDVWSQDNGRTWGEVRLMDLPNNNSGTDAVTLRDGRHLLVYNHAGNREGKTNGPRSPLNVAISNDGRTWEAALVLETEPNKEFSYPAVIQTTDGLVHITYTWKREFIKHVVVDPVKVVSKPITQGRWPQ
ncbi:MAG: sialidase family protein [Prosthecobacter sp.]